MQHINNIHILHEPDDGTIYRLLENALALTTLYSQHGIITRYAQHNR